MGEPAVTASPGRPADLGVAATVHRDLIRINRALRSTPRPDELTAGCMSALWTIAEHAPIRATEVAELEGVTGPTMSRLVGSLEHHGLLARSIDRNDRRVCLLSLTPEGVDYVNHASSKAETLFKEALYSLDSDDRAAAQRVFARLAEALSDPFPDSVAAEPELEEGI